MIVRVSVYMVECLIIWLCVVVYDCLFGLFDCMCVYLFVCLVVCLFVRACAGVSVLCVCYVFVGVCVCVRGRVFVCLFGLLLMCWVV